MFARLSDPYFRIVSSRSLSKSYEHLCMAEPILGGDRVGNGPEKTRPYPTSGYKEGRIRTHAFDWAQAVSSRGLTRDTYPMMSNGNNDA